MDEKSFLEICERSNTGKKVEKNDWDMDAIVENVMDLVEKYDLTYDENVLIPEDESLFHRLFDAAKELLVQTGVYNLTTKRVIKLSEDEIEEGIQNMRQELVMGEGKDAYKLVPRKIEDELPPAIWAGNPGCPTPESIFYANVKSVAKEPIIDLLTCGSLVDVDGIPVRSGEPSEIFAVRREMKYLHQALDEVGRPGMGMLAAESAVTEAGDLSASNEKMLRPCDSHLVALFNELMIDNGNLVRAANSFDYGVKNASLACTMVGGLGGDAPGSTIIMIASMLAANIVAAADYHLCHPIHIHDIATSSRRCLWLQASVCETFAVCAPAIIVCDIWPASGCMTKELLYEVAANAIVVTVSGGHLEGVGSTNGTVPNGSGLEVRLMGEVGKAVSRMKLTRTEANTMVLKLLRRYEHIFQKPGVSVGLRFDEVYDLKTLKPLPAWQKMYEEVKADLCDLGLPL